MTFVYVRGNCVECCQDHVYGWELESIFTCCACHDQYEETDTRPVMTAQITGDYITGDYITEQRPPSPLTVIVWHT